MRSGHRWEWWWRWVHEDGFWRQCYGLNWCGNIWYVTILAGRCWGHPGVFEGVGGAVVEAVVFQSWPAAGHP